MHSSSNSGTFCSAQGGVLGIQSGSGDASRPSGEGPRSKGLLCFGFFSVSDKNVMGLGFKVYSKGLGFRVFVKGFRVSGGVNGLRVS